MFYYLYVQSLYLGALLAQVYEPSVRELAKWQNEAINEGTSTLLVQYRLLSVLPFLYSCDLQSNGDCSVFDNKQAEAGCIMADNTKKEKPLAEQQYSMCSS